MSTSDRSDIDAIRWASTVPRDVAQRLGLKGRAEGAGVKVLCPAHGDRSPSCSLTRGGDGTLRVKCFSCDFAGDIFSLVAAVERLDLSRDFPAVLERAAELFGVRLEPRNPGSPRPEPRRLPPPPVVPAGPPPLEDALFDALVSPLLWTGRLDGSGIAADVTAYLRDRGLLDLARDEGWAALPPPDYQAQLLRTMCDVHGLDVVARSGLVYVPEDGPPNLRAFVHAAARLIIPWRDAAGRVTTLQRRRLDGGSPKYVFATGRRPRDPYGIEQFAGAHADAAVAFVEGAVDTIALRELLRREGTSAVVLGLPGVSAWSKERAERWSALARGRVAAVALDADGAGARAAAGMLKDLFEAGTTDLQTWPPRGAKDWAAVLEMQMKGAA